MTKEVKKNKFRASKVGALIENLRAEIKPILEDIPGIKKKASRIYEQVGKNAEKLILLEMQGGKTAKGIVSNAERIEQNRRLLTRVLANLKSKIDLKNFETLKKKVASLTT